MITASIAPFSSASSTDIFIAAEEEDEDNMEEIDTDNIISDGRRTRGKRIDFQKAAEENPPGEGEDDDDDDDDEDFQAKGEEGEDSLMQE